MKMIKTILHITITLMSVFMLQTTAFALDQSALITVNTILKTETSWDGTPIVYPQGKAEITGLMVEIAPGGETGWHLHATPSFGMLIDGELEITLKNGDVKHLKAGDALAEVVDTLHNGRNIGPNPVRLVVFYAGVVGQKLTEKEKLELR